MNLRRYATTRCLLSLTVTLDEGNPSSCVFFFPWGKNLFFSFYLLSVKIGFFFLVIQAGVVFCLSSFFSSRICKAFFFSSFPWLSWRGKDAPLLYLYRLSHHFFQRKVGPPHPMETVFSFFFPPFFPDGGRSWSLPFMFLCQSRARPSCQGANLAPALSPWSERSPLLRPGERAIMPLPFLSIYPLGE